MLFNSLQFIIFYIVITSGYYAIAHRWRWALLLLASCYFYMVFVPKYIIILMCVIVIDYVAGIYIEKTTKNKRKYWLLASIAANVGILFVFKYYSFFNENLTQLTTWFGGSNPLPIWSVVLPIGLSFHTFQAMSYTIEVYKGKQKAERHLGHYALYVLFYPQLVAGPIERPQNILPQFKIAHRFDAQLFKSGLWLMLGGFFRKVVIADRLAVAVNAAYNQVDHQNGLTLALATILFAFQIYCDFSGYSDIAIGAARTMGFKLMTNFDKPYLASNISQFWHRWHISLSTWFRDYVYIPLGGNRVLVARWFSNLIIVFLLSGFWHGANWTFIIWGLLHGIYLISEILIKRHTKLRLPLVLQRITTFVLVCLAWIFFRANTVSDAFIILQKIGNLSISSTIQLPYSHRELIFCGLLISGLLLQEQYFSKPLHIKSNILFIFTFLFIALLCYWFGIFDNQQFIYFQF